MAAGMLSPYDQWQSKPMHPSGEVGRFEMDSLSSPPGDW